MRSDAACQDMVAVQDQMMGGDRGRQCRAARARIGHALLGGDMFHHHAQLWDTPPQRIKHGVDEHRLAVKNINRWIGYFAVGAEWQADFGHFFQHRAHFIQIAHPGM